jgi:predicted acetyltransferase
VNPALRLLPPCLDLLPAYADALMRGWSPDTTRDVSGEQLARLKRDGASDFLRDLCDPGRPALTGDGRAVPRLPGLVFWIVDDAFCGTINLRYQLDGESLPPHVSGHVGYAIVPWKQNDGRATRALALILPVARAAGLARVMVTCDAGNLASQRVIEKNGGQRVEDAPPLRRGELVKRCWWVATG